MMLVQHARCSLFQPFLLLLDAASQAIIFRPLMLNVLSLCIQVKFLFCHSGFGLGMSFGHFDVF